MILETPSGPLHWEVTGPTQPWASSPPTLVFCHGVATNCDVWSAWLPVLAPSCRIVRFDTRGFGRSFVPGRAIDWDMDRFADDIVSVARAAGAERFHLVGESMGGTACLQLACRADAPLLSLTCLSTAHRGGLVQRVREWREQVPREGIERWSDQMMERRFFDDGLSEAARQWFSAVQRTTPMDSLLEAGDLLIRTDLTQALPRIAVPTLLIAPDTSPFVSLEITLEIKRLIPDAEMAVFAHSRHGLPFSHGEACAATLRAFLTRRGFLSPG